MKDPIYYYFIVPVALLLIQLIALILIIKFKSFMRCKYNQISAYFKSEGKEYRIVTVKEAKMRAEANEQQRIADNHKKLTTQGFEETKK